MDKAIRLLDGTYVMDNKSLKHALGDAFMSGRSTVEMFKDDIAMDSVDFKAMYETEGQDNAIQSLEFYNFIINVCVHVKNVSLGKGKPLNPQDDDNFSMEVYKHAFANLTTDKTGALEFGDFKYYVSVIAYGVYAQLTYQVHRASLSDSMDAIQTNEDGVRLSFYSYDAMLERRVNRGENAQTLTDKAIARTSVLVDELKDKLNAHLPNQFERTHFWSLIAKRLDEGKVLTSSERRRLSEYRTMIQASVNGETVAQNKQARATRKALKVEQSENDKAIKLAQKIAKRNARYEERKDSFVRAMRNAYLEINNAMVQGKPIIDDSMRVLDELNALINRTESYVPTDKDDDKALAPFRLGFKYITDQLLASTPIQRENAKALRKAMKGDKTV